MAWNRKFPSPIVLKDGRTLVTLADARALVRSLSARRQRSEEWQYASGLLLEAATQNSGNAPTVVQLIRALKAEGLI